MHTYIRHKRTHTHTHIIILFCILGEWNETVVVNRRLNLSPWKMVLARYSVNYQSIREDRNSILGNIIRLQYCTYTYLARIDSYSLVLITFARLFDSTHIIAQVHALTTHKRNLCQYALLFYKS